MKKFAFSLERLRLWREKELEQEEEKLRLLQGEYLALELALRRVLEGERIAIESVMSLAVVTVEEIRLTEQWRSYAQREVRRINAAMTDLRQRIEDQRERTLAAHRRLEAMSRLKEQQFEEWRAEAGREEESTVQELVVSRYQPPSGAPE